MRLANDEVAVGLLGLYLQKLVQFKYMVIVQKSYWLSYTLKLLNIENTGLGLIQLLRVCLNGRKSEHTGN